MCFERAPWRGGVGALAGAVVLAYSTLSPPCLAAEPAAAGTRDPLAEPRYRQQARAVVARAKALFAVGDYGGALAEFTRALRLLEGDPRQADVLNNIAVCHERMFRYDLALEYYQRFLDQGTTDVEDRAEVRQLMDALEALLARVAVTTNTGAEAWVDARRLQDVPGELLIPAGAHTLELRAAGYESTRKELSLAAGERLRLHVELTQLPEYHGIGSVYFYISAGLTVAALTTGAVLGASALSEASDAERLEQDHLPSDGPRQRAQDLAFAADVAFASALVFGVSSTILYFLTDWQDDPGTDDSPRVAFGLVPEAARVTMGASLRGVLR